METGEYPETAAYNCRMERLKSLEWIDGIKVPNPCIVNETIRRILEGDLANFTETKEAEKAIKMILGFWYRKDISVSFTIYAIFLVLLEVSKKSKKYKDKLSFLTMQILKEEGEGVELYLSNGDILFAVSILILEKARKNGF